VERWHEREGRDLWECRSSATVTMVEQYSSKVGSQTEIPARVLQPESLLLRQKMKGHDMTGFELCTRTALGVTSTVFTILVF